MKNSRGLTALRELQSETQEQLSAIIAAPIKGKTGGTRALCHGRRSYRTEHNFQSDDYGELTVPVMVVRTRRKRRDGTYKWEWLVYVLIHVPDLTARQVRKAYRRRFGIESSYWPSYRDVRSCGLSYINQGQIPE